MQHLQGSNCYKAPAPGTFAEGMTEKNLKKRCEMLRQNVQAMDDDLSKLGFDVNCAPVCDLLFENIPSFIGDLSSKAEVFPYHTNYFRRLRGTMAGINRWIQNMGRHNPKGIFADAIVVQCADHVLENFEIILHEIGQ